MSECEFEDLCKSFFDTQACAREPQECEVIRPLLILVHNNAIEQAYAVAYGYDEFSPLPERIMQLRMEENP